MEMKLLMPADCEHYHDTLKPWVQRAMDFSAGESTTDDIMDKLVKGIAQCWVHYDDDNKLIGVTTTEIFQYQRKRSLHVITCAGYDGEFKTIGLMHDTIEAFAKDNKCDTIVAWCRQGWSRVLDRFPFPSGKKYRQSYVVMEMEL